MAKIPVPILDSGDYEYGAQFQLGDDVYAIRYQTTDDGYQVDDDSDPDAYQSSLVKLGFDGTRWKTESIARLSDGRFVVLGLNPAKPFIANNEIMQGWNTYLDLINEFLIEGGSMGSAGFPVDGTVTEKIEWLVANTKNVGGQAVLVS